jgi:hypothetical protein
MSALFILVLSSVALVKFAVSQWRAIWIAAASQPLSEELQLTAGIDDAAVGAQDFGTLIGLCDKLSPGLQKTSPWLREVSIYYRLVEGLEQAFRRWLPSFSTWARREMHTCSRYVAVVLSQSLSMQLDRQLATRGN